MQYNTPVMFQKILPHIQALNASAKNVLLNVNNIIYTIWIVKKILLQAEQSQM